MLKFRPTNNANEIENSNYKYANEALNWNKTNLVNLLNLSKITILMIFFLLLIANMLCKKVSRQHFEIYSISP